jgi:hypothetical protein
MAFYREAGLAPRSRHAEQHSSIEWLNDDAILDDAIFAGSQVGPNHGPGRDAGNKRITFCLALGEFFRPQVIHPFPAQWHEHPAGMGKILFHSFERY